MDNETTKDNESNGRITGTVWRKSTGRYLVKSDDGREFDCAISSALRKVLIYPEADPSSRRPTVDTVRSISKTDPVTINDRVLVLDAGDGTGMINEVLERSNHFSRLSGRNTKLEQVIAANIDQVVIVSQAENAGIYWSLLDCYLADAECYDQPAVVCITKMDVADDDVRDETAVYENIGYSVLYTSSVSGQGLDDLRETLKDKVSVLVGKSGVGKSSLLNALQPGLDLFTKEVSGKTGKGMHATTHLEMFEIDLGDHATGRVIDTPGVRKFGLWDAENLDIAWLYVEMRPYIGQCRFGGGCSHTHEPGCAIKQAVESGEISRRRYESFLKLAESS